MYGKVLRGTASVLDLSQHAGGKTGEQHPSKQHPGGAADARRPRGRYVSDAGGIWYWCRHYGTDCVWRPGGAGGIGSGI